MTIGQEVYNYEQTGEMLGKAIDPVQLMMDRIPRLTAHARLSGRNDAHSYRDFHVAGAVIAINEADGTLMTDIAGNLKRANKYKICVERKLEGKARKLGASRILGLVVLGTTDRQQIREVTGIGTPTLHCCSDCRRDLSASPLVTDSTIIYTSGLESDINQTFRSADMVAAYDQVELGSNPPELFSYESGITNWDGRLKAYQTLAGAQATELAIDERLRFAALALSCTVKV